MKIESVSYRGDGNRNNEDYILYSAIPDHCVVIILADGRAVYHMVILRQK